MFVGGGGNVWEILGFGRWNKIYKKCPAKKQVKKYMRLMKMFAYSI